MESQFIWYCRWKNSTNVLVHSNEIVNSSEYPSNVFFNLDIDNYPELKILRKKDCFFVSADVESVKYGGNEINFKNITNLTMTKAIVQSNVVNREPGNVNSDIQKNGFNNLHINNSQVNINGGTNINETERHSNKKSILSMDNPLVYVLVGVVLILITYYLSKYGIKS